MATPSLPQLGPRARKVARYAGFVVLGLVTFIITFQLTFPFSRVKDKVVEALSEKYEVTIGDVHGGIMPGRVYFKAISLRTRPTAPDDVATTFYIEQLELDISLLALIGGTADVDLDAKIGPGHITGNIALSKTRTSVDLVGENLPSASLPMREVVGLPMSGKLEFAVDFEVPSDKAKSGKVSPNWSKGAGVVQLACPSGCSVGDGKTKLRPKLKNQRNQAFAEGGIYFGKVNIDSLLARVELKNGKLEVTKFDVKSGDGEVHVELNVAVNPEINNSVVTGCLRFRGSDVLLKRDDKTHAAISTTGAPLGPDNLFHIKLDGPLRDVKRLGQVCTGGAGGSAPSAGSESGRPNLSGTAPPADAPPPARSNFVPSTVPPAAAPAPVAPAPVAPSGNTQGSVVPVMPPPPSSGLAPQPPPAQPYPPPENAGTVVPAMPNVVYPPPQEPQIEPPAPGPLGQ